MTQEVLKDLLPKFIGHLETKGRSPSTILAYRADLEQLLEFLVKRQQLIKSYRRILKLFATPCSAKNTRLNQFPGS